MPGALAQLPDSSRLTRLAGEAEAGYAATARGYAALDARAPGSALAPATEAFASLRAEATVDVAGLTAAVEGALRTIWGAVPAGAQEFAAALDGAFRTAAGVLEHNPLLDLLPEGSALRDVALQVVDEAVALFERRVEELAEQVIGAEALEEVRSAFAAMQRLRSDPAAHADELPAFVAGVLLGFRVEVLRPLRVHMDATGAVVASLDGAALAQVLDPVRVAAEQAVAGVADAVERLDPAVAAGYDLLVTRLDGAARAVAAVADALQPLYGDTLERVASHAWERLVAGYLALADAVPLAPRTIVGEVLDATASLLDELVDRAKAAVAADEVVTRVEQLGAGLHAAVAASSAGEVRQQLLDFLGEVRDTIAAVPLRQVRQDVLDMLHRVGQEIDRLGLERLAEGIEKGFGALEELVRTNAQNVRGEVEEALDALLGQLEAVPVAEMLGGLQGAVQQVGSVVESLRAGAEAHLDDLEAQLAALEDLSFRPVSDRAIAEIDEIRGRLAAMRPEALSEEEKLAIRAALAVLEALDVETKVVKLLSEQFHRLQRGVRDLLDRVAAGMEQVRGALEELPPQRLLEPLTGGIDALRKAMDGLNVALLLAPLHDELDALERSLGAIRPGSLLQPLQPAYDDAVAAVRRLDPESWGAPLVALHEQLTALVGRLDLTPLFDALDERRRELLSTTREALVANLRALDLPEPLAGWFARVHVLLEDVTDLLFLDPAVGMRALADRVRQDFTVGSLYEPLESAFGEVMATLAAVPAEELVQAATTVRDDLAAALDTLEPARLVARLRAAHRRLVEAAPDALLAAPLRLPAVRLAFHAKVEASGSVPAGQVAKASARFDAVLALVAEDDAASLLPGLRRAQERALVALRQGIDGLDVADAQAAYLRLRAALDRLVPPSLALEGPLTVAAVLDACEAWRPSRRSGLLDQRLAAFVAALRPLAERLDAALDRFAGDLRATAELLDPLALDDALREIFDAVGDQVEQLEPGELLADLRREVYLPVVGAVAAVDPGAVATRLDAAFHKAHSAVTSELSGLLSHLEELLAEHLRAARAAVNALLADVERVAAQATEALGEVVGRVDDLVFVGLLERLRRVLDNLGVSFDAELERVRNAFDAMLDAAPIGHRIHPRGTAA